MPLFQSIKSAFCCTFCCCLSFRTAKGKVKPEAEQQSLTFILIASFTLALLIYLSQPVSLAPFCILGNTPKLNDDWDGSVVSRPFHSMEMSSTLSCKNYTELYSHFLPNSMLHNTEIACKTTPVYDDHSNCIRYSLLQKMKLDSTFAPSLVKQMELLKREDEQVHAQPFWGSIMTRISFHIKYSMFLMRHITPIVYRIHYEAYKECGCVGNPAPYLSWHAIMLVPWPKRIIDLGINTLGSCHCQGLVSIGW